MRPLVPPLVVGAGIAMLAATAGLLTGMNTVLKVGAVITVLCLAATAGINFRFEQQRARQEREQAERAEMAEQRAIVWARRYLEAGA